MSGRRIIPAVVGQDVGNLESIVATLDEAMQHNSSPKAALDIAAHDLFAQSIGVPLYRLFGGFRASLGSDFTISLKYVTDRVDTGIMADESAFGPREALRLIAMRACDSINIKLMKAGGLGNAARIAAIKLRFDPGRRIVGRDVLSGLARLLPPSGGRQAAARRETFVSRFGEGKAPAFRLEGFSSTFNRTRSAGKTCKALRKV
jgi:hypothetical protein